VVGSPGWGRVAGRGVVRVGVEDADVEVADQDEDADAGVASSEADEVQAAVVAEGDDTGVVDAVVADAVVAGL